MSRDRTTGRCLSLDTSSLRRRSFAVIAFLFAFLGTSGVAYAYCEGDEYAFANLYATPHAPVAGTIVSLYGRGFYGHHDGGYVDIRLNSRTGVILTSFPVTDELYGTFRGALRIPSDVSGVVTLIATQYYRNTTQQISGGPGRDSIEVTPSAEPEEESDEDVPIAGVPELPDPNRQYYTYWGEPDPCRPGEGPAPRDNTNPKNHHIATDKNTTAPGEPSPGVPGDPWTKIFRDAFFDPVNLSIRYETHNIVPVVGHIGGHPQPYHRLVFDRLRGAVAGIDPVANREAFIKALYDALDLLAQEARTFSTRLNHMLTHPWCYK